MQKIQKKTRWSEPSHGRQKGRPKKGQKMPSRTKEGRELVPLVVGITDNHKVNFIPK